MSPRIGAAASGAAGLLAVNMRFGAPPPVGACHQFRTRAVAVRAVVVGAVVAATTAADHAPNRLRRATAANVNTTLQCAQPAAHRAFGAQREAEKPVGVDGETRGHS
jgi:hypothetical protein